MINKVRVKKTKMNFPEASPLVYSVLVITRWIRIDTTESNLKRILRGTAIAGQANYRAIALPEIEY